MSFKKKFLFYLFFTLFCRESFAGIETNSFDPIFEIDVRHRNELIHKILLRLAFAPVYIYIDGKSWEKITFTFLISGVCFFYYLSKKDDDNRYVFFLHISSWCLFFKWFFVSPIVAFIDYYMDTFDKKFDEI